MESKAGSEGEKETGLRQAMLNIIDQSEKMQLYSRWDRKPAAKDGNIAQFAMCLPCKPKDLILIPRTHCRKPNTVHASNPSSGEADTGRSLESTGPQPTYCVSSRPRDSW